ncbi:MAG: SDR family oxidoreductase [Candidatus Omnitrophica bacterium]|nr:SDR family oxidoreductase [Candidatus Omnitrophota bacterium]
MLIIGAAGLIGSALHKVFLKEGYNVLGVDRDPLIENIALVDINDIRSLAFPISQFQPNTVILTAALTSADYCEIHPDESEKVNIGGLMNVIDSLRGFSVKFVFISSDYVFNGISGPYSEDDPTDPLSVYGKHKLAGERIVKSEMRDHLIVRTTWVYGTEIKGKNFVCNLIRRVGQGEFVKVPTDQVSTPTYAYNLAQAIEELVHTNKAGTYNIVGDERMGRFDFANSVCEEFGLNRNAILPVLTEEFNSAAPRPLLAGLIIDKLKNNCSVKMLGVKEGLAEFNLERSL